MGNQSSTLIDNLVESTNFTHEEIERIRKRFLKIDANRSGTIDRDEFLSIPAIATNPLAHRLFAVVDRDGVRKRQRSLYRVILIGPGRRRRFQRIHRSIIDIFEQGVPRIEAQVCIRDIRH